MSLKLNENQFLAVYLIATGVKASVISKQLNVRAETLSRWRQDPEFKKAVMDATEIILREIIDTHKNILITSQNIIIESLQDKKLALFQKATIALRYLNLMKGKDDISRKSSNSLNAYMNYKDLNLELLNDDY